MSYDFDAAPDNKPPIVTAYVPHASDLEAIVMLLEVAALHLTPMDGATFTFDDLLTQAYHYGGSEVCINELDARIVVDGLKTIAHVAGDTYRLAPVSYLSS